MLDILDKVLKDMPNILQSDLDDWSATIIESAPRLERLKKTIQVGEELFDIFLHRGYNVGEPEAHSHPCEAAMYVAKGTYKLELCLEIYLVSTLILNPGCKYEMTNPSAWHCFTPMSDYTLSVMVAGRPYKVQQRGQPGMQHIDLSKEKAQEVLDEFRNLEW